MNCNCIERINAKLKEAGHDYQIAPSLVFDEKMRLDALLSVRTQWSGTKVAAELESQIPELARIILREQG